MAVNLYKSRLDSKALARHKKRFLRFFPESFRDQRYIDWERTYKMVSHKLFMELLNRKEYTRLLNCDFHDQIANRALKVESFTKPPFLFSFEKMALRDALKVPSGATDFSEGLFGLLYEKGTLKDRFVNWIAAVVSLPRKQSRVASWPVLTFFPFIAQPDRYMILKPSAMLRAAEELRFDFDYSSKPTFRTYESLMIFADLVSDAISDLGPENYHDIQTFLWVIGSAEYEALEEDL